MHPAVFSVSNRPYETAEDAQSLREQHSSSESSMNVGTHSLEDVDERRPFASVR